MGSDWSFYPEKVYGEKKSAMRSRKEVSFYFMIKMLSSVDMLFTLK